MEKYSTKENETYREHAEKAVHKAEEHGQKARHNLQENMQKLKDDAQETAIEAENEAKTGVRKMAGKIDEGQKCGQRGHDQSRTQSKGDGHTGLQPDQGEGTLSPVARHRKREV